MKTCKCLLPETHETIEFNNQGACNICIGQTFKKEALDGVGQKAALDKLIERHRGNYDYDCIVPFSGGKDSTWTLYYLMKEYKIKPLVVRFDHGFMRPNLEENVRKVQRELGVDMISFTPNWPGKKVNVTIVLDKETFAGIVMLEFFLSYVGGS